MKKEKDKLPIIFEKILNIIEENGGTITTEEFKECIYNLRFKEDEIINELYDIKIDREKIRTIKNLMRLTKSDAKDIKKWLSTNGYISINHGLHEEIITQIKTRS